MKKFLIAPIYIILITVIIYAVVYGIDLSDEGTFRRLKVSETQINEERFIKDTDGKDVVIYRESFTQSQVNAELNAAKTKAAFWHDVNAVDYVNDRIAAADANLAVWQRRKDKFAGAIDSQ